MISFSQYFCWDHVMFETVIQTKLFLNTKGLNLKCANGKINL